MCVSTCLLHQRCQLDSLLCCASDSTSSEYFHFKSSAPADSTFASSTCTSTHLCSKYVYNHPAGDKEVGGGGGGEKNTFGPQPTHRGVAVVSLRCRCDVAVVSLWFEDAGTVGTGRGVRAGAKHFSQMCRRRSRLTVVSLWCRCGVAVVSPRFEDAVTAGTGRGIRVGAKHFSQVCHSLSRLTVVSLWCRCGSRTRARARLARDAGFVSERSIFCKSTIA